MWHPWREVSLFFDVIEINFGGIAIHLVRHEMRGEDLEGPEGRLASWFGGCAGVANQHNLDLMDVLRSKSDSRSFIEVYNSFVFLKN